MTSTPSPSAALVYADFWRAAADVYEEGEALHAALSKASKAADESPRKYVASSWLDTLAAAGGGGQQHGRASSSPRHSSSAAVVSRMLVTPSFSTFNASLYRTFAVSLSASLSRLTGGRMRIEVFHPEYVGGKDGGGKGRRTPWPCVMICYERE